MGMIEDLGAYLDAGSTRFAAGTNLFYNYRPSDPNRACSIVETPGQAPARAFGSTGPSWEQGRVQVVCRSTSSATARADIDAVFVLLEAVANSTLTANLFLRVSAVQSPFLLGRDEQGRPMFACNFDVWRVR
jgi:hypothetical protein